MSKLNDRKRRLNLSKAYVAGEKILGVKFRHNSQVRFIDEDGNKAEGWIVAVGPIEPELIYTIERADGGGDEDVRESVVELLFDPHKK